MTKVLSLINMKGGVGKTTLAMQLGHTAASRKIRTLAVRSRPTVKSQPSNDGSKGICPSSGSKKSNCCSAIR